jgi:predicted nucleic acid-binding protein
MATAPDRRLVDTDILIDALRGAQDAIALISDWRHSSDVRISIVSAMELIGGCRNSGELAGIRTFLRNFVVVPISASASVLAQRLMESFHLSHGLQIPDALIGATALEHGLALFTRNTRHFSMIPGLGTFRPY